MRLEFFNELYQAFPRSWILFTGLGAELFDLRGELIGYVPNTNMIVLSREYEHYNKALEAVRSNGIRHESESAIESLYKK